MSALKQMPPGLQWAAKQIDKLNFHSHCHLVGGWLDTAKLAASCNTDCLD